MGNIENLLDYETVAKGEHPQMEAYCYSGMFSDCTILTSAPSLPATTLTEECYYEMFSCCTILTSAPSLPATTLAKGCYGRMFQGCSNLITVPSLPATVLTESCYEGMFRECPRLTTLPELQATSLAKSCCKSMFEGCARLKVSAAQTDEFNTPWRILTESTIENEAEDWNSNMLFCTGGTFSGDPNINTTYYLKQQVNPVPIPPTNATVDNVLMFSSKSDFTLQAAKGWDGTLYYSADMIKWTEWEGGEIESHGGKLYLCGFDNMVISGLSRNSWVFTGSDEIDCTGNIESLLDYKTVAAGEHPAMARFCYYGLFQGCTSLATAPSLPATTLTQGCYMMMFNNCTSLTTAPSLPATTLAQGCYAWMFDNCTSLIAAPSLPATTLADYCYYYMFRSCTSLTTAPSLPATTLADYCYYYMFSACTSLTTVPSLPATKLAEVCYSGMFIGCSNIKISDKKTEEYPHEWRIPSVGEIDELPWSWNGGMILFTGGSFTSDPQANTTYYLAKTPITTDLTAPEAPASSLVVSPNPGHGIVSISGLPACVVQFFDVAGRLVLSMESDGSDTQSFNISGLASGVHFVRAGSQSAKLIVR